MTVERIERDYGIDNLVVEPEDQKCQALGAKIYNVFPQEGLNNNFYEYIHDGEEAIFEKIREFINSNNEGHNKNRLKIPGEGLGYIVNYGDGEYTESLKWFERSKNGEDFFLKGIRLIYNQEREEWVERDYNTPMEEIIDSYERDYAKDYFSIVDNTLLEEENRLRKEIDNSNGVRKEDLECSKNNDLIRHLRNLNKKKKNAKREWENKYVEGTFRVPRRI